MYKRQHLLDLCASSLLLVQESQCKCSKILRLTNMEKVRIGQLTVGCCPLLQAWVYKQAERAWQDVEKSWFVWGLLTAIKHQSFPIFIKTHGERFHIWKFLSKISSISCEAEHPHKREIVWHAAFKSHILTTIWRKLQHAVCDPKYEVQLNKIDVQGDCNEHIWAYHACGRLKISWKWLTFLTIFRNFPAICFW